MTAVGAPKEKSSPEFHKGTKSHNNTAVLIPFADQRYQTYSEFIGFSFIKFISLRKLGINAIPNRSVDAWLSISVRVRI